MAPTRARDETVHLRDDASLIAAVKALGGTDSQVFADEAALEMVLPSIRTDCTAAETYRYEPEPLLETPIHATPAIAIAKRLSTRSGTGGNASAACSP